MRRSGIEVRLAESVGCAYPGESDLWLDGFSGAGGKGVTARVRLAPGRPGFRHLQVKCDQGQPEAVKTPVLRVRFERGATPLSRVFDVTPVFADGAGTPCQVVVELYPSAFYAASGLLRQPDALILKTRPLLPRRPPGRPVCEFAGVTPSDRAYARRKWGGLVTQGATDLDRARLLALSLARDLAPHNGVPSDAMMRASPFRQYRMMVEQGATGYCENWAVIFVHACRALGVRARAVWLEESFGRAAELAAQAGSCHLSTEVFDRSTRQWIWIDNRFHCLGAYLGKEGPLTLAEFCLFLNEPSRRARLRLLIQTPADASPRRLPLDRCPKRAFDCFEGWHRTLRYEC